MVRGLDELALALVIVGALNWGLVGLFEFDLVAEIVGEEFGSTNVASRIVYTAVGAAGVYLIPFVARRLGQGERTDRTEAVSRGI